VCFLCDDHQKKIAEDFLRLVGVYIKFKTIVTLIEPATTFYVAEDYQELL
jgi:peptide methionine sulfoxide reductase MsrA